MQRPNSFQVARGALKFTGPFSSMLGGIGGSGPIYVHSRNWMVEMASIVHLGGIATDEEEGVVFFPEEGLHLALGAVEAVHGVEINCQGKRALALEVATRGETRSLSFVAIPNVSNVGHFTRCMDHHPAEILTEDDYKVWRDDFMIRPSICPCCQSAAEERRAYPERNPLTRILCHAIENELNLRCEVVSPVLGFTTWLQPGNLQLSSGILGAIARDGRSMLEIDLGICHNLKIVRRVLDDEAFSEISLYDSLGTLHFRMSARGWDKEMIWRGFFP